MVRTQRWRPRVCFLMRSISQALLNSPKREPYTHHGADYQQQVAEEREPNDAFGRVESPQLSEHIAQHVGKGEGDGAGIEVKQAKQTDDFDGHDVGGEIKGDKKGCHHQ